ncbi:MAG TPA: hypothetical protein VKQ05_09260 [Gemmatimonadales bacterium]|nr:hypothetical protein [Gemmatimonadales bacterium]
MRRFLLFVCVAILLSCSDSTSPGTPNAQLHIVQQDTTAPPLVAARDSFWAVVGQDRQLRLNYQARTPADTEDEFLRFEVPGDGLLRKPDGSAFQPGDSVLITITVLDTTKFQLRFEPSGLQFNPNSPARLQIEYDHANHDYNNDGVVDSADSTIGHTLGLWRRENPTAAWFPQNSVKFEELEEFDANILSFTEYAIAW